MTFAELAEKIGEDKELILQKLEIVFGVKPNLEDEIIFNFPERGRKKEERTRAAEAS